MANEPYRKLDMKPGLPLAGLQTKRFTLGSCIYAIRPTISYRLFGKIIGRCWYRKYESKLKHIVRFMLEQSPLLDSIPTIDSLLLPFDTMEFV